MNIQTKKKVNKAFLYAVQIFVAVVFVIPLVWMIVSFLKPEVDIFKDMNSLATLMLNNPTLENYKEMFARSEIVNSMLNSTFYIGDDINNWDTSKCFSWIFFSKIKFSIKK